MQSRYLSAIFTLGLILLPGVFSKKCHECSTRLLDDTITYIVFKKFVSTNTRDSTLITSFQPTADMFGDKIYRVCNDYIQLLDPLIMDLDPI